MDKYRFSRQLNFGPSNVCKSLIDLPQIEEQQADSDSSSIGHVNTEITALETRRAKTQAIKQGMMQELLTGRTRLNVLRRS